MTPFVAGLMGTPAPGAVLTRRLLLRESLRVPEARLKWGPFRPYLWVLLKTPVLFAAAYGVWRVIVPDAHPLLGGIAGLVGLALVALPAAWAWRQRVPLPASSLRRTDKEM